MTPMRKRIKTYTIGRRSHIPQLPRSAHLPRPKTKKQFSAVANTSFIDSQQSIAQELLDGVWQALPRVPRQSQLTQKWELEVVNLAHPLLAEQNKLCGKARSGSLLCRGLR
jgi:hypothetical protein